MRVATTDGQMCKQVRHHQAVRLLRVTSTGHWNSGGNEAAVHATRRFVSAMGLGQVLVKLDFTNAFNTLRRDAMLEAVYVAIPEIHPFALQSYSEVLKSQVWLFVSLLPGRPPTVGPAETPPFQPTTAASTAVAGVGFKGRIHGRPYSGRRDGSSG